MADTINATMIYCHQCSQRWPRSEHGLSCPHCQSEFVEFIGEDEPLPRDSPSPPQEPINDYYGMPQNPFEQYLGENITRHQYRSGDGRVTYTSTTIRSPMRGMPFQRQPPQGMPGSDPLIPLFANLNALFQGIVASGNQPQPPPANEPPGIRSDFRGQQNHGEEHTTPVATVDDILRMLQQDFMERNARPRDPSGRIGGVPLVAPNPLEIVARIMGLGRHGDAVYSQEELDRVISELIEQTANSNAPGPASEEAIQALPKKQVDKTMLGHDGKAECSICMDSVQIEEEVTELPCKHWFHGNCISAWLVEHDTCPHCRRGIMETYRQNQSSQDSAASQSSSSPPGSGSRSNPYIVSDDPSESNGAHNNQQPPSGGGGNGRFAWWMRTHFGGGGNSGS
uniref:RING-type E3 ubiquitin transferase n=1 Tax=Coccidioides posadasii RMSCC 3488 TaxID=454284 RepID=A0A0J6FJS9_COCPO|nr:RING finger protein 126-A [Coccidioides posadasii RMSCC 3488]